MSKKSKTKKTELTVATTETAAVTEVTPVTPVENVTEVIVHPAEPKVEMPANIEVPRELPGFVSAEEGTNPYKALVSELNRAFHHFNKVLANGELKTPIINVLPRGRKKAYGWFGSEMWSQGEGRIAEICICAETLDREVDQVLQTLIHEMAHLMNAQKGIKDCNAIQYHNREFKKAAEALGLTVERVQGKGFAKTILGPRATAAVESLNVDKSVFAVKRNVQVSNYKKVNYVVVEDEVKAKIKELGAKHDCSEREVMSMIFSGTISLADLMAEPETV